MKLSHKSRALFFILADCLLGLIALAAAFLLGAPGALPSIPLLPGLPSLLIVPLSFILSFGLFSIYNVLWEQSCARDFYRIILSSLGAAALILACILIFDLPVPIGTALTACIIMGGTSLLYRMLIRDFLPGLFGGGPGLGGFFTIGQLPREKRILIVGAGEAGRLVLTEYQRKGIDRHIAGFADDDPAKIGRILNGKKVFASTSKLPQIIRDHTINEVIIAFPSAPRRDTVRVVSLIQRASPTIPVKTLPPHTRIFENPLSPDLREIGIADILEREEITLDAESIQGIFSGKTVLITGAGGSIGSELCKQLLKFRIKKIIALGRGEHSIYTLIKSLNEYLKYQEEKPEIEYRVADVRDASMLGAVFSELRPHIVFHAAAHKHVPLMEFNEREALGNNVLGTRNVLEAASRNGVERFVLISTDKAVRPVNVMGATKRAAEIFTQHYHREKGLRTSIVRFGNVIGSRGSVLPLFREQIERGGPVTVTHPDVTRYFMSIPEAALLVINAAAYSLGGEIFVLDMGKQYRVMDVAESLIRLYGLEPGRDIGIEITGLRPGEKMYEELSYNETDLTPTENRKILILHREHEPFKQETLDGFLSEIEDYYSMTPTSLRECLRRLVPEFSFNEEELSGRDTGRLVT